jgi:hypothetical protein
MRYLSKFFTVLAKPVPTWVVLLLVVAAPVFSYAASSITASLTVPTGGTIQDPNATASTCAGYDTSKNIKSGANCVDTSSAQTVGGAKTWSATQAVSSLIDNALSASAGIICTDSGKQLTTSGCIAGGDTITSPGSSLSVGGTSTATTLDLNLARANTWTATQTVPQLIDNGLTALSPVCADASKQLTSSGCASGGDTITSPAGSLAVGGTSSATTLDLNLAQANAWTAALSDTAQISAVGAGGAGACSGTKFPTTVYGVCIGANNGTSNVAGIVMSPVAADWNCTASCTAGDSSRIYFFESLTTGATSGSSIFYNNAINQMEISSQLFIAGRLTTTANSDGGTCTESSATSCTVTLGHSFGTPVCVASDNTAPTAVQWTLAAGSTTLTLTTSASASDKLSAWCWGNGS